LVHLWNLDTRKACTAAARDEDLVKWEAFPTFRRTHLSRKSFYFKQLQLVRNCGHCPETMGRITITITGVPAPIAGSTTEVTENNSVLFHRGWRG
jgi:hypothetical protein